MKVNEIITNQIIENLETSGKWIKGWRDLNNFNIDSKKARLSLFMGYSTKVLTSNKKVKMYKLDEKMKQNKEITNRILDLINDSQEMTDSDIQGCLDAILLDYEIVKSKKE